MCSRCFLEVSKTGASVSILNIRGWFGQNGTTKVAPAFSVLIFFTTFGMIEYYGKV